MNRRMFLASAALSIPTITTVLGSSLEQKISGDKNNKINNDNPVIHYMNGPHFQFIQEENGEMFCRDMCDCGCIDKKWKINEGDTIVAWRPSLYGHLKNLKIIAIEFKIFRTTTLEKCRLYARDFEKHPMDL